MKILFISSEVVPFAKTGGLADVAGSLPKALKAIGHDVRVFMPRYKTLQTEDFLPDSQVPVYFFENEKYFGSREGLYQLPGGIDYKDNVERFAAFCQAVLPTAQENGLAPGHYPL